MNEHNTDSVTEIVIVGGGSAGWLTAGVLAAEYSSGDRGLKVTLIESPDVPTVGVGEGTWPTMRATLKRMGVAETDFLLNCDASFKQGSRFFGWRRDDVPPAADEYFHPFTAPAGFQQFNPSGYWRKIRDSISFADAVNPQAAVSRMALAPKHLATPEYAFNLNYGYHLDAGKFAEFLRKHCTEKLGVVHQRDRIVGVSADDAGFITELKLQSGGVARGDLFVDCSGAASLLIGKHYGIGLLKQDSVLFNDSALAVQVPYPEKDSPIASCTHSTACGAGWIWDIGLPTRRGVGYTYSSAHLKDGAAEQTLRGYIAPAMGRKAAESAELRKISFVPGYREQFWHKNCVAIGMSAGFIEPLEASALVLVEQSAKMLAEQLPPVRHLMSAVASQFNQKIQHHWLKIIDFLKLHYVLSERGQTDYWRDHRAQGSITSSLQESLSVWRYRSPWREHTRYADELFPEASYQYILNGMGFDSQPLPWQSRIDMDAATKRSFYENQQGCERLVRSLPTNRQLINKIREVASKNNASCT